MGRLLSLCLAVILFCLDLSNSSTIVLMTTNYRCIVFYLSKELLTCGILKYWLKYKVVSEEAKLLGLLKWEPSSLVFWPFQLWTHTVVQDYQMSLFFMSRLQWFLCLTWGRQTNTKSSPGATIYVNVINLLTWNSRRR